MNNHTQKDSLMINKADALIAEALWDDVAFDTEQWQRYIEQEIGLYCQMFNVNGWSTPSVKRHWPMV